MENKNEKPTRQEEQQQPGSMSSYNNRENNREGQVEDVKDKKGANDDAGAEERSKENATTGNAKQEG